MLSVLEACSKFKLIGPCLKLSLSFGAQLSKAVITGAPALSRISPTLTLLSSAVKMRGSASSKKPIETLYRRL